MIRDADLLRAHAWWAALFAGLAAVLVYTQLDGLTARTALILSLVWLAAAAGAAGLLLHRPARRLGWWLVLAATLIWAVGWAFWQGFVYAHDGAVPSPSSWQNMLFLTLYVPLVAAVVLVVHRRERDLVAFVDTGIVAASLATVAWAALIARYVDNNAISPGGRAVQIAFALGDVLLLAAALRAVASPGPKPRALLLLAAGILAYLGSNAAWNWSTQLGSYTPGAWADAGWLLASVLIAGAMLHPSMSTVFAPAPPSARPADWGRVAVLLAAVLVAPATTVGVALTDPSKHELLGVAACAALLAVLVVARLALLLREQARQNERLLELDRLKDDFVSSVSHELRTPLTSIRGYLELLLDEEEGGLTPEQRRFLTVVDRNSERLLRLVGDLLFVAQVEAGKLGLDLGSVELDEVVAEAAQSARPVAEDRGIELVVDARPVPAIRGDRSRLAQLVDNLVSNALKFTPSGGRVEIRAHARNGSAVLEVADTGIGISPDEQALLFDRFFRSSAASAQAIQGTGLGLAIAKAIAEGHGGTVGVDSDVGRGTTFRVELPLAEAG